jgi:hypothetical protein
LATSVALAALALGVAAAAHGEARAAQKLAASELQERVDQAERLFVDKRYAEALKIYRETYFASEVHSLLYMVARCQEELGDLRSARASYEAFLADRDVRGAVRTKAEAALAGVTRRLRQGQLTLVGLPAGAEVKVDGRVVGKAPLAVVEADAGERTLAVALAGYEPLVQTVNVKGGEALLLRLTMRAREDTPGRLRVLVSEEGAEIAVDGEVVGTSPLADPLLLAPGDHELAVRMDGFATRSQTVCVLPGADLATGLRLQPPSPYTPWHWVAGGAGVAALVAGTVAYALGESDHDEVQSKAGFSAGYPGTLTQREALDLEASGDSKKAAGYGLWTTSAVLLAGAGVLLWLDATWTPDDAPADDSDEPTPAPQAPPAVGFAPIPGGAALTAVGRF